MSKKQVKKYTKKGPNKKLENIRPKALSETSQNLKKKPKKNEIKKMLNWKMFWKKSRDIIG